MLATIALALTAAVLLALGGSMVMMWGANRSALSSMLFGAVLALLVLAGVLLVAYVLTRAAFPH